MNALVIIDESSTGQNRAIHATELALELARSEGVIVRVYLMGSAIRMACVPRDGETISELDRHVSRLVSGGVEVAVSEAEMHLRGLVAEDLLLGAQPTPTPVLAAWTLDADRILVF